MFFEQICLFFDMQIFYEHLLIQLELSFNMKIEKLVLHVQKTMLENYIFSECLSQNILGGRKPFLRVSINDIEILSTIG
jgi:hypothetical protein